MTRVGVNQIVRSRALVQKLLMSSPADAVDVRLLRIQRRHVVLVHCVDAVEKVVHVVVVSVRRRIVQRLVLLRVDHSVLIVGVEATSNVHGIGNVTFRVRNGNHNDGLFVVFHLHRVVGLGRPKLGAQTAQVSVNVQI